MEKKVRGGPVNALYLFVQNGLEPPLQSQVLARIPEDLRTKLGKLEPGSWYPFEYSNQVLRAIASTEADPLKAGLLARQAGRYIANEAINTFLRLLVKFLSPSLFARKFHDFFRKDHNFGKIETDLSQIDQNRFVLTMSEVGGYDYVSWGASGWMIHTLSCMGCKNVQVTETLHPPPAPQNADSYRFEVSWSD